MSTNSRKVTVQLPGDCATKLTTIAEHEGRTLAGELLWLALKRVTRKMGGSTVAKGRNDDEVKITLRMPRELHDRLADVAQRYDRTLSAQLRALIREKIAGEPAAEADPFTGQ